MTAILRLLFWTWLVVSLVILAVRLVRARRRRAADRPLSSGIGGSAASALPDPGPSTPRATPPVPSPGPAASPRPAASTDPRPSDTGPVPDSWAATRAGGDPAPGPGATRQPLATLLQGITMPCDLLPIIDAVPRPSAFESVAFVTTGVSADDVERELQAELVRLGFEVGAEADGTLAAERDGSVVRAAVHRAATAVQYGGRPAFPGAVRGAVAVELFVD